MTITLSLSLLILEQYAGLRAAGQPFAWQDLPLSWEPPASKFTAAKLLGQSASGRGQAGQAAAAAAAAAAMGGGMGFGSALFNSGSPFPSRQPSVAAPVIGIAAAGAAASAEGAMAVGGRASTSPSPLIYPYHALIPPSSSLSSRRQTSWLSQQQEQQQARRSSHPAGTGAGQEDAGGRQMEAAPPAAADADVTSGIMETEAGHAAPATSADSRHHT